MSNDPLAAHDAEMEDYLRQKRYPCAKFGHDWSGQAFMYRGGMARKCPTCKTVKISRDSCYEYVWPKHDS